MNDNSDGDDSIAPSPSQSAVAILAAALESSSAAAPLGFDLFGDTLVVSLADELAFRRLMAAVGELHLVVDPGALLAEQIVNHAGALAAEGRELDALWLVASLLELHPDAAIALRMYSALVERLTLREGPPAPFVAEARMAAARTLNAYATTMDRWSRRVDESLLPLLLGGRDAGDLKDVSVTDDEVLVNVLCADATDVTTQALLDAGMTIDDTVAEANLSVGRVPVDRLAQVAAVATVRRIEPLR